ncbi:hypothetical protein DPMN_114005 [Dreissena polymorpha]|uniref:Sushi domain-containing protein n=1 Tax=Dreissena polymorpha TaxID=45954 RepID=A0A9D4QSE0_DREPO|nr:hypothetical protein DPMN_114005 [Dreissena polymorpha]
MGERLVQGSHCAAGYSMQGRDVLTCRTSGSWDFSVPTVVSVCSYCLFVMKIEKNMRWGKTGLNV